MNSLAEAFVQLKPLFEVIIREPKIADIRQLNGHLDRLDGDTVQILQGVFLQQLVILVDSVEGENKNEVKTCLLECVCTILGKIKLRQTVAMKTTLIVLMKQIYDNQSGRIRENLSEEFKLGTLRALTLTTMNVQSDLVEEVYTKDNLNLLSQILFVCVTVIAAERYRKLRLQAVQCILAAMQVHDESDFGDPVLRCQVAELLFIVLPKLLVAMVSVVNGDDKQGTALTRTGIKALGRILGLVFEDYDKIQAEDEFGTEQFIRLSKEMSDCGSNGANILGMGLRNSKAREDYFSNTVRNREWLLEAEKKVSKVLSTICHIRGAEEESVRLEFARINAQLLEKCAVNMPSCSTVFLETLLALSQDESSSVRNICEAALKSSSCRASISFGSSRKDELFYESLKPIPRSIYRSEESTQIGHFRLMRGYINFLSDQQLNVVLSNQEILNQLLSILVAGAELDQGEDLIRREYVSYHFEYAPNESKLAKDKRESRWIVLRNFQGSVRSQKAFLEVMQSLMERPEALSTILNYILEDLFTTKLNTNGYLFLLSELIPQEVSNPVLSTLFRNVFTEMLQSYHWDLELTEFTQIADLKFNVLHICLSLRLIARFAQLFRRDFRWQLYDTLRYVLPLSGSDLNCVNEAAELTLDAIAASLQVESIPALIFANLDYISQHISHCLRRQDTFPRGVHILESVLRFVPYESSAVLESTISPIVVSLLDGHDDLRISGGTRGILCLRVLQIFVRAIRYRYQKEVKEVGEIEAQVAAKSKFQERIALLKKELDNKLPEQGATIEEIFDDDTVDEEPEEPDLDPEVPYQSDEDKLPPHIRITKKILTVNFKYLSSSAVDERIVALGTLEEGIHLLREHENQLLPLVHQIWFNIAERFADSSPVVISCAFDLLVTLARLAKDFIRKRTLDDVLPRINRFMRDNVMADFGAHQTYKLQRKILDRSPELVMSLKLNERQLDQVMNVAKLYLVQSGRAELRSLARKFFEAVSHYDPGAVCVKLSGIKLQPEGLKVNN